MEKIDKYGLLLYFLDKKMDSQNLPCLQFT